MYKTFIHDMIAKKFLQLLSTYFYPFFFNEFAHAELAFPSTSFFLVSDSIPLQSCTNFALWKKSYLQFKTKFPL